MQTHIFMQMKDEEAPAAMLCNNQGQTNDVNLSYFLIGSVLLLDAETVLQMLHVVA